jgi:hypothetical protein
LLVHFLELRRELFSRLDLALQQCKPALRSFYLLFEICKRDDMGANFVQCRQATVADHLKVGVREHCALRWSNIDLDSRTLRVEQSLEQTQAGLRFKARRKRNMVFAL